MSSFPAKMKQIYLVLSFMLVISIVQSRIDFIDCGTNNISVKKIKLSGCMYVPCQIQRGSDYFVQLVLASLDSRFDAVEVTAYVSLFGALFPVNATTMTPTFYNDQEALLEFKLVFCQSLLRNRALLYLQATYKSGPEITGHLCVSFKVQLV
ncbi:uncharacterized protein [Euwallacea fornicatus]|uniref:uncharacterized protein n=1 Tax=Euwallacea fornicatus TaxID=995702 RepID=UPI00338DAEE7